MLARRCARRARCAMADDALQAYYARDEERDRLGRGVGRLEFARTIEILQRTLPAPGAVVADIGGGPGRYTDWLVAAGYEVVHRDLVAHHVEQVAARHGGGVDTAVGDACALDLADESADAVLLLGPLYHLDEPADRVAGARRGTAGRAPRRRRARRRHLPLGAAPPRHARRARPRRAPGDRDHDRGGRAQWPHAAGARCRVHRLRPHARRAGRRGAAAGLELESVLAVEGIGFALADLDERMDDPAERALLMDVLRAVESVPELLGSGRTSSPSPARSDRTSSAPAAVTSLVPRERPRCGAGRPRRRHRAPTTERPSSRRTTSAPGGQCG